MLTTEDTENTEKKRLIVQLVAGLLASGHYTYPEDEDDAPGLKSYDIGASWQEDGYPRRHLIHALDDAEMLLRDIEFFAKKEEEE